MRSLAPGVPGHVVTHGPLYSINVLAHRISKPRGGTRLVRPVSLDGLLGAIFAVTSNPQVP